MANHMSRLTSPGTPPSGAVATAGVFSVVSPLPTLFLQSILQSIIALSLCQGGGRGEWTAGERDGMRCSGRWADRAGCGGWWRGWGAEDVGCMARDEACAEAARHAVWMAVGTCAEGWWGVDER